MTGPGLLRDCFASPIPEIFEAARLLARAVEEHAEGNGGVAATLIETADLPEIGVWLDPIWLRRSDLVRPVKVDGLPPVLTKEKRCVPRMPDAAMKRALIERDGFHCRFCGMPLVRAEVRKEICRLYPAATRWTSTRETDQHRGLQVMWLQYDHVLVHSRGGATSLDNMVIACAACNFGRDRYCIEEVRFSDPRANPRAPAWDGHQSWSGLEGILPARLRISQLGKAQST